MKDFLTNRQISLILYASIVGYGVIDLPTVVAENSGTGAWFSISIVTCIFVLFTYIITYLQFTYEGKTIYDYSEKLIGKLMTNIFSTIAMIYFILFFSIVCRGYCETINTIMLPKTPIIYLCLITYIVICYALIKGINTIARTCEIYIILSIIGFIFINLILCTKGKLVNIKPFFNISEITRYIKSSTNLIFPFLGIEVLFTIPVNKTINKGIFKYTNLMIVFIGLMYIFISESTISNIGVSTAVLLKNTVFQAVYGIDIPYLEFLRRPDGIYIVFWSLNAVCTLCAWGYAAVVTTSKLIRVNNSKSIIIIVTSISFIISQIPKNGEQIKSIIKYNSYLGVVIAIIIPTILFLITKVRKYDKKV